ncbi:MAG TPA: TonB family protein [Candidatus Angelobacter sp.]|jgi:protein TonB|nr:TonB family protein [Candidatus Angelobacter sp.]
MFEDSLMESGGKIRTNAKWTTAFSTLVQLSIIGILVLLPLIFTEALPKAQLNSLFILTPPPPPPPPPPPAPPRVVRRVSEIVNDTLRTPSKIPKKIEHIVEDEAPPPASAGVIGGVVGGVPGGTPGGVIGSLVSSNAPPPPPAPKAPTGPKKVSSGVMEGNLIKRIDPPYPNMAKIAHIQGDVVLQATISKQGTIENLRGVSGHPILIQAAMEAVRQWRYRPYELNSEPVEVETTVTVRFHM